MRWMVKSCVWWRKRASKLRTEHLQNLQETGYPVGVLQAPPVCPCRPWVSGHPNIRNTRQNLMSTSQS